MNSQLKASLLIAALCCASFSLSMQANFGIIASYNCEVSTYKFINTGKVTGLNGVKVNVSSLTGSGTVSGANYVDIKTGYFGYTGTISAGKTCTIKAATFEENATIESHDMTIICEEFNFRGTLHCSGTCTIYVKKSFDTTMFKRLGQGTFKVVVSPHDVQFFSKEGLVSQFGNDFYDNCLNLDEKRADDTIKKMRTHATLNTMDDKEVLNALKKNLEEKANFHKNRSLETQDKGLLCVGLGKCGLTVAGLVAAYLIYTNESALTALFKAEPGSMKVSSALVAALSTLSAISSYPDFCNGMNPRHQEKHEKLSLLISRIDQALATKRVSEELVTVL